MSAPYPKLKGCAHLQPLTPDEAIKKAEPLLTTGKHEDVKAVLSVLQEGNGVQCAEVTYSYGDLVVNDGTFNLPGVQARLNDASPTTSCKKCGELQRYFTRENPVPLLLNLTKALEVFRVYADFYHDSEEPRGYRTVPIAYREPGELIGIFEYLRPVFYLPASYGRFNVSAGSRNVHLVLPLKPGSSSLADHLSTAFSDPEGKIRRSAKQMDVSEYGLDAMFSDEHGLPKRFKHNGIACDWRIIRSLIGEPDWKASMLMVLLPPALAEERMAGILFRTGFYQAQDALSAFNAEGPSQGSDKSIFMNVEQASVPSVLDHLAASVDGGRFVHVPAGAEESKGPWPEFVEAMATSFYGGELEIRDHKYLPVILEPRKLGASCAAGFMSFTHLLIPHVLYLHDHRTNTRWVKGTPSTASFRKRLKKMEIDAFTQEYPKKRDERHNFGIEGIEALKKMNPSCWPELSEYKGMLNSLRNILPTLRERKLSRLACLSEFMTVLHREQAAATRRAGVTTA
jgi:hypothetical protein